MSGRNYGSGRNGGGLDKYQRQYQEQLERYSRLDGSDYDDDDADLQFTRSMPTIPQYDDHYDEDFDEEYDEYSDEYDYPDTPRRGSERQPGISSGRSSGGSSRSRSSQPKKSSKSKGKPKSSKGGKSGKNSSSKKSKSGKKNARTSPKRNKKMEMEEEKRRSPIGTFFKCLLILVIVLLVLLNMLIFRYLNKVNYVDTGERQVTSASMSSPNVQNILVIGSDTRSMEERGRTDSMILLSINKDTKEMTMTSFMRDMYVEIPGYGWAKMNAAYVYGGAELLMDTIELNFDIEVERYIYIDFFAFVDIVDAVGGIELDISDAEAQAMNDPMNEQNMYLEQPQGTDNLESGGKNILVNGNQALAYARTRYVGNADFERTERQRTVMTKIMEKAKTLSPMKLDNFFRVCAVNLTTNMTKSELYFLVLKAPFVMKYENRQLRIPEDGAFTYGTHNGQSTLDVDFDMCRDTLRKEIYGE